MVADRAVVRAEQPALKQGRHKVDVWQQILSDGLIVLGYRMVEFRLGRPA